MLARTGRVSDAMFLDVVTHNGFVGDRRGPWFASILFGKGREPDLPYLFCLPLPQAESRPCGRRDRCNTQGRKGIVMTEEELESVYEALANGMDAVAENDVDVFLVKVALALAEKLDDPGYCLTMIEEYKANLVAAKI